MLSVAALHEDKVGSAGIHPALFILPLEKYFIIIFSICGFSSQNTEL